MNELEKVIAQLKEYEAPGISTYMTELVDKEISGTLESLEMYLSVDPEGMNEYTGKNLVKYEPSDSHIYKSGQDGDYRSYLRSIVNRVWKKAIGEKPTTGTRLDDWFGWTTKRREMPWRFRFTETVLSEEPQEKEEITSAIEKGLRKYPFILDIKFEWEVEDSLEEEID
jgi:hypothetical protein